MKFSVRMSMISFDILISPSLAKRRVGMSSITLNKMVATKAGNKGWDVVRGGG